MPTLICSRQGQLYSQHSGGMLLHAVAWQPGTFHKCLRWLALGMPCFIHCIAVACCCMRLHDNQAHFISAYAGVLSASPAIFTAELWHAVASGCKATRHMQKDGSSLAQILKAGQWKSSALLKHLDDEALEKAVL